MRGMLAKGTPVISLDSGVTLGKVESVYLDCETRRLVAFTFSRGTGLLGRKGGHIVEVDDIHAIGPDAVTLDDARAVHDLVLMDGRCHRLIELDQLVRRNVMTDGGSKLGHIVGLDFDPATYRLLQIRVDGRHLPDEIAIPAEAIMGIGEEIIVVSERRQEREAVDRIAQPRPVLTPLGGGWRGEELRRAG